MNNFFISLRPNVANFRPMCYLWNVFKRFLRNILKFNLYYLFFIANSF